MLPLRPDIDLLRDGDIGPLIDMDASTQAGAEEEQEA